MNYENAFARSLSRGIPPLEAANYFVRVKQANWVDPPDETGQLEGQFAAPMEQVLLKLTEVISAKFKLMVTYHVYAESMRDPAQHGIGEVFHEHAEMERAAAEAYLKRAAALGGPVHLPEIETPPASSDPIGILKIIVRAEQEAIALQSELKAMVGDQNPLSFQIEQFMIEDQHHHDEAWQMLPQETTPAPVLGVGGEESAAAGSPAGLGAPPPPSPEPGLSEEAPPPAPAAAASPPEPKPASESEPKPKAESKPKPDDKAKEAAARFRLKLAGMADDIIGGMDPGDRRMFQRELQMQQLEDRANTHSPNLAAMLGIGPKKGPTFGQNATLVGGGAALGGLTGALKGLTRSKTEEKRLHAGGPISRWAADHPASSGAISGALSMGGATAGALALPKVLKPVVGGPLSEAFVPLGLVGGAVLPQMALHATDRSLQRREQEAAKQASARFQEGLRKLALMPQGMPEAGTSTDPGAAPTPEQQNAVMPQPSMAAPGPQPPMATEPGMRQYEGTNYLEAESIARQQQAQNESQFYQQQAQQAQAGAADAAGQLQQIQGQLDQLQQQVDESQNQVMAAQQEAVTANDQMLNQATLAARMRMGMQQLRAQMMEIASQDPEQLAAAAGGPTPMDVGNQAAQAAQGPAALPQGGAAAPGGDPNAIDPMTGQPAATPPQAGTPEAAPGAQAQQGSTPSGAGGGESKSSPEPKEKSDDKGGETTVSIKKGSAPVLRMKVAATLGQEFVQKLPYMGAGALAGGVHGVMQGRDSKVQSLREQVDALKGQQDGGFSKSLELAKAHMALSDAESAKQHPYRAALKGGLAGAALGAGVGTAAGAIPPAYQRLKGAIQTFNGLA